MEKAEDKLLELVNHHKNVVNIIGEVSSKVNASLDLKTIFQATFELLDNYFGFKNTMILLVSLTDPTQLILKACHGYKDKGLGALVPIGRGVIGVVAKNKKLLRMGNLKQNIKFLKSVTNADAIKLPGIENCVSQLAVPLIIKEELIGVISIESSSLGLFYKKDEDLLELIGVQIAIAINNVKLFETIASKNALLKELNNNLEVKVIERTKELAAQKELVEQRNKEVMDSIKYAVRIQNSILPTIEVLEKNLLDHFILFKPKDIVSGDFYWLNRQGNKVFYACVDCTGHGVPGAFVSMLGSVGLRRAVTEGRRTNPAEILESLNDFIENAINKSGNVKDGMDIALCCIDYANDVLEFSGANNGVLICRNGELIEIAANKQPIGSYEYRKPFTNHTFNLLNGDTIYTTTDGYFDQFGGLHGKKFMKINYKNLILENQHLSLPEQGKLFNTTMNEWIDGGDQIDDICVIGVRYNSHHVLSL